MSTVLLELKERIALITMNNPSSLNALSAQTLEDLDEVFSQADSNEEVDVIIITGSGKAFVAGADISEMKDFNAVQGEALSKKGNDLFLKIENSVKPTIAAINGFALGGGCELALSCDIRVSSQRAKFGQPEVALGITPGFGGTQRLARTVGGSKAKEMILTGDPIDAIEAERIGLVSYVTEPEAVVEKALEIAKAIGKNAQVAVRLSKLCINKGLQMDIESGVAFEAKAFGECFSTEDQKDAMAAFVEKRPMSTFKNK